MAQELADIAHGSSKQSAWKAAAEGFRLVRFVRPLSVTGRISACRFSPSSSRHCFMIVSIYQMSPSLFLMSHERLLYFYLRGLCWG
jgi:hypothetical protein